MQTITFLIPCYNEAGNIKQLNQRLQEVIKAQDSSVYLFDILLVNDGSSDDTLEKIKEICIDSDNVNYISLSRNFGHQNAMKAGIDHINSDAVITLDADLQHPPEMITEMIKYWEQGYDVVNTKRLESDNQGWLKKLTSNLFYYVLNLFSYVTIESGTADFRLFNRKVNNELKRWNEQNLFFRGIIPWLGFNQYMLKYHPEKRYSGETKYTFRKMFSFAMAGITSFSIKPLRVSIMIGVVFSLISVIYMLYAVFISVFTDQAIVGWTSVIVSVLFIGGIQLLMIGVIGEYLGKLFIENKKRPNYIVNEKSINEESITGS